MYSTQVPSRDGREGFKRVWLKAVIGKENDRFVYVTPS